MQDFNTPMMKQYLEIKKQHMDCLLFYRMGDFYELFLDDALVGAKVLDITLTSRAKGRDGRIPMAGVPYHAVDPYLNKLVKSGYKVAICEQVSEPDKYGIVDREVIRIVTPGTVLDEKSLEKKENNYIISIAYDPKKLGIALADISTGQFLTTEISAHNMQQTLIDELSKINPSECILSESLYNNPNFLRILQSQRGLNIYCYHDWVKHAENASGMLKKHFGLKTLESFGIEGSPFALQASAALLGYLKHTQKDKIEHFKKISLFNNEDHVVLDRSTIVNLELFSTIRDQEKQGSLVSILDETTTAMGGRLLRNWIRKPLKQKTEILKRHDAVEYLIKNSELRDKLEVLFKQIADIERILSRLSVGIGNARDLVNLKLSLLNIVQVKELINNSDLYLFKEVYQSISVEVNDVINIIEDNILDEPNIALKEGGLIKSGLHEELDQLRKIVTKGKSWILNLEEKEKQRSGIASLKIRYNKVFGFYIEISNSNLNNVPKDYMRKQTLVNGERFITPELKEQEHIILTAEEKMNDIEFDLFNQVLKKVLAHISSLQQAAYNIAILDCIHNFANLAEKHQYTKPNLIDTGEISINGGRHPVVEQLLIDTQFVPNDVTLNHSNQQLMIITGPNMAGKSVFIRQVAVITLMAQIGSFIPAQEANITIVDRIFVRSGASDVITSGLSTFMVEMVETAQILNQATENSLIIMDEIGRGTSTYDGISIAWAVAENIAKELGAKTLFATHYHELQELEKEYPNIKNFHMAVENQNDKPIFLHTILPGGASHSFGVAVAKLAGVPQSVVDRATEMLTSLESRNIDTKEIVAPKPLEQLPLNFKTIDIAEHVITKELHDLDIHQMTPLEALNKLAELKEKLKITQLQNETFLKAD